MPTRKVAPRRVARLQRRFLRAQGATPEEIRRYLPVLTAQIGAESNFTQGVGSPAGARDIAQFMPGTAPGYGVKLGDDRIKDDIRGQVRYMLPLLRKHGVEGALRGYNAGPGAIEASKGFSETNAYVDRVLSTASQYRGLGGGGGGSPAGGTPGAGGPAYRTIPGVDNSGDRQQLMQQYLLERGKPQALLSLKMGLDQAQDVPERRVRVRGAQPGQRQQSSAPADPGDIFELFWNGENPANIDNGKPVKPGFVSGHTDHVHLAAPLAVLKRAAALAKKLGLTIREFEPYDDVDPVHAKGSYHYPKPGRKRGRAMDVSGARMAEFANRIASGDF
ncbi:MAG TPA: lytic transglycosylase domain-containing protein [Candidatus Krumholzibacteria bacterium]|nr:lytic transglycosylase domain-containing protein [Candidatus Krumholzibacteria bacterium]